MKSGQPGRSLCAGRNTRQADQGTVRRLTISIPQERRIVTVEPPGRARILAIAAHPDDIESWCAGTLARAVDARSDVRLLRQECR